MYHKLDTSSIECIDARTSFAIILVIHPKKKRGQQLLWYKLQNIIYVQSQAIPMEGYHFVSNGDGDLLGGKHTIQNK